MNNIFKITVVAAVTFTATGVFAAPAPHKHHHHNNGIRLATDIVNLVNSSIRLLTGYPKTVYVAPAATVQTVVATPPAPAQTVIIDNTTPPPPPRTVIINNPTPPPPRPVIINNRNHHPRPRTNYHPAKPRFTNQHHRR